ncbi:MAG: hypothetical protein WBY94_30605 [Polyangiaceae bacterium]|jgi:hypothetical protein
MTSNPRTPRHSKLAALVAPAAVVVAGGLLVLRLHFQPPTVPPYTLATSGDVTVLRRGGHFELDAVPTREVTGAVGARAFLVRGTEVRPWDPPFEVSRDGSAHIRGQVDGLFAGVPPGDWEIDVAIGRPEMLPTAPKDVLRARDADVDAGAAAWRLVRERIHLGS